MSFRVCERSDDGSRSCSARGKIAPFRGTRLRSGARIDWITAAEIGKEKSGVSSVIVEVTQTSDRLPVAAIADVNHNSVGREIMLAKLIGITISNNDAAPGVQSNFCPRIEAPGIKTSATIGGIQLGILN